MDVGAELREAREACALSIDGLARRTKIKAASLLAVQENRRDLLPDDVYLRGFVRAYAREVGLDPDNTARRYLEQFAPPPEVVPTSAPSTASAARLAGNAHAHLTTDWDDDHGVRDHWIAVAILLAVTGLGYSVARSGSWPLSLFSQNFHASAVAAAMRRAPPAPAARPSETAGTTGSAPAMGALHVDMRATGWCWVTATVDGTRIVYHLMRPDERQTFDVRGNLVLRVGEPAALALWMNGVVARTLGHAGEPVTVKITRENYRDFLEPEAAP
ncbi:MAG: helix-turn-helix domain-containing protein [Deltaproteobacteria bacterium]